jgi:hypothetical protein
MLTVNRIYFWTTEVQRCESKKSMTNKRFVVVTSELECLSHCCCVHAIHKLIDSDKRHAANFGVSHSLPRKGYLFLYTKIAWSGKV